MSIPATSTLIDNLRGFVSAIKTIYRQTPSGFTLTDIPTPYQQLLASAHFILGKGKGQILNPTQLYQKINAATQFFNSDKNSGNNKQLSQFLTNIGAEVSKLPMQAQPKQQRQTQQATPNQQRQTQQATPNQQPAQQPAQQPYINSITNRNVNNIPMQAPVDPNVQQVDDGLNRNAKLITKIETFYKLAAKKYLKCHKCGNIDKTEPGHTGTSTEMRCPDCSNDKSDGKATLCRKCCESGHQTR